mgnify:CR=1 FL=1
MANKLSKPMTWLLQGTVNNQVAYFLSLGYQDISEKDMWDFLLHYRWKKKKPETIKEMKTDIKKITPNDFFDYQQVKAMTRKEFPDLNQLL